MHVTKQTAHKLAAAGYPQPEQTGSGAWYADPFGETISTAVAVIGGSGWFDWSALPGAVYAPNVVELLEVMTGQCMLSHVNGRWEAFVRKPGEIYGKHFYSESPALALAEAYLYLHQPPQ